MALIEDFNEKAKQIIQNDSTSQISEEDETIEIIELDGVHKDEINLETLVIDGEFMIDNDPDGDICIDSSIFGGSLIDDERLTEGVIDGFISSNSENEEELMDNSNDDVYMA